MTEQGGFAQLFLPHDFFHMDYFIGVNLLFFLVKILLPSIKAM